MSGKTTAAIGGCMVLAGAGAGLIPVSSSGTSCGSALHREGDLFLSLTAGPGVADDCASLLSVLAIPTWVLIGVGLVLLLAGGYRATAAKD